MNPQVDAYILSKPTWTAELNLLRSIIRENPFTEDWKWRQPCYTINGKNVLVFGAMKEYCIIGFFKGALLKDPKNLLFRAGEHTQTIRTLRFKNCEEIEKNYDTILTFLKEAIFIEETGIKIETKAKEIELPFELEVKFKDDTQFERAFHALTPGRKRGYLLYFSSAKQEKTRIDRIQKCVERILKGKGIDDCICGLSKRMPRCDGSHKFSTNSQV